MFRSAASMAGPGPAKLWEALGEEGLSSCLFKSCIPPLCGLGSAFPRQETACSGDTCEHEKGEGVKQREEIYSASQLSIYTPMERG